MTNHPSTPSQGADGGESARTRRGPAGRHHRPSEVEQALTEFADHTQQAVEAVNKRAGRDILAATAVALGILGVIAVSLVWCPWVFVALVAAAIAGGQIETGHVLAKHRGAHVVFVPLLIGSVLGSVGVYAMFQFGWLSPMLYWVGVLGLTAVVIMAVRLSGPIEGYVCDTTASLFLLLYPGLLATSLILIVAGPDGPARLATFVVGVAATDTGGYLVGVLFGKHQFAPRISPKKSWEGVAGSVVLACVLVPLMVALVLHEQWWKGLVLALVLVVVGIAGDLVESVIKRDVNIKDMGTLLPGHGGIMDRIDGYILAGFPAWVLMSWMFNGV
ncbi:MAG: phosphatidate cytidylyltransferase [Propionibacteriaceae bacterium]|jgi:phosphatidate cytidylyltransferase|nr:phosphatidate cytidylyltransferase [Propionibacteriaceae bacterium]